VKHHIPWKKTEVVYQGVDPTIFCNKKEKEFELEHPAVAIIQNHTIFTKVQGLLKFKRVIKKLNKLHFYITTGEKRGQTYFPIIESELKGLNNVHFLENIFWPDGVRKLLSSCDIYVLASGLDACPTTVLEASLMEKPVIASYIGGVPEIILEGKTGWTVQNDDIQRWIEKIVLLIEDDHLKRLMGIEGRRWVKENFNWNKTAAQVETLLNTIN
jgi:glycosyltransferase involved in cell wall biosynthesis